MVLFTIDGIEVWTTDLRQGLVDFFGTGIGGLSSSETGTLYGPSLYSGSQILHPIFVTGNYTLYTDRFDTTVAGTLDVTSTGVSAPSAVTPEPSNLALLGTGVLGVLGVAKRRFA